MIHPKQLSSAALIYQQKSMAGTTAEHGAADLAAMHRQGFQYAGCYCEENVWLLCQRLCDTGKAHESELIVVFMSNPEQQVLRRLDLH